MATDTGRSYGFRSTTFEDGFGKRHHADAPGGAPLEVLQLREEFSTDAFEAALRERVTLLSGVQSTWFSQVRMVQRMPQDPTKLFVVYDRAQGSRLSSVLALRRTSGPIEVNAALCVVRQLLTAVALLHQKLPAFAHGAIAPERIIITPKARLVVADHVLGSALEQLNASPEWYWKELRVLLPQSAPAAFDQRADVMQIGVLALELMLGRAIDPVEYPDRMPELTEHAWRVATHDGAKPVPAGLSAWLVRMLQLEGRPAFTSAMDAWADLEHVLGSDNGASFAALEHVMAEDERQRAESAALPGSVAVEVLPQGAPLASSPGPALDAASGAEVEVDLDAEPEPAREQEQEPQPHGVAQVLPTPSSIRQVSSPPLEMHSDADVSPALPGRSVVSMAPAVENGEMIPPHTHGRGRLLAVAAALVLLIGAGALFGRSYLMPAAAAEAPGTLVVNTNPEGFQVFIDGNPRGVTPLSLELAPGAHELRISTEGEPRIIPFTVTAGSTVSQTIDIPRAAPRTGQLMVRTEPAGARVTLDGVPSGTTPLTLSGLTPGQHSVTLATELSSVSQEVTIEPGTTASLVVPMTTPQGVPVSGWISVDAPAEVQIREGGRLLGTSETDRIMVAAGPHDLEIVNEALGYRATRSVTVSPGKVSAVRLDWPKGTMALNAEPWADVWVNGEKVGETPVGKVVVPVGTHDVVFRHPELGERTVRATVTAAATPTRVTVDMRKR